MSETKDSKESNDKAIKLSKQDLKVLRQIRVSKKAAENIKGLDTSESDHPEKYEEADLLANKIILHRLMRILQIDDDEQAA